MLSMSILCNEQAQVQQLRVAQPRQHGGVNSNLRKVILVHKTRPRLTRAMQHLGLPGHGQSVAMISCLLKEAYMY